MKSGNIFVAVGLIVLIIIFIGVFMVYYQVNIIVTTVRKDLFYAVNHAILSFDVQDLSYKKYTVNKERAEEVIQEILNQNYKSTSGGIISVGINELEIIHGKDKVEVCVLVKVRFKSVINLMGDNEHEFKMAENIKISLLQYGMGVVYE